MDTKIESVSADADRAVLHKKQRKSETSTAHKSHRKRKRHHLNAIRAQMEFYFGDANLSKDRFLKQLIDKDPFVPLEVFLTFNKMKTLTTAMDEIAKSLSSSQLLELDETQQRVRRKTALPVERNVDEKTLYVEALPPTADHDWVRQVFERFGAVSYVSLPKYAKSRKIKEFGFVEFEQEGSVEKAVKAFKEFSGVLSMQEADPAELKSVKAFVAEQNQESVAKAEVVAEKKGLKRGKATDADEPEVLPKPKKVKTSEEHATIVAAVEEDNSSASETADDADTNDEDQSNVQQSDGAEQSTGKKKRRRKKKKSKATEKRKNADLSVDAAASYYELKILPKRDWKRLRNKYLNLQREKIAELKRKAWKERQQQAEQQAKDSANEAGETAAAPTAKKVKPNERKLHKMNMNFYGAGEEEPAQPKALVMKETKQNPALERTPLFSYEPGLIVEVGFMEPCVQVKEFKSDMRQYEAVKYIDVKEGAMHAHLRLDTAAAAEDFVKRVNCAEYKCKALLGDAETEYWKKIELDREMKLNKQVKVPHKRGREKVKKLLAKHIRFGDDEEE